MVRELASGRFAGADGSDDLHHLSLDGLGLGRIAGRKLILSAHNQAARGRAVAEHGSRDPGPKLRGLKASQLQRLATGRAAVTNGYSHRMFC